MDAVTSGGNVNLTNMRGTVSAGTSGGSMKVEISELGESIDLSNSSGNITVELPMNQGMDLDLSADRIIIDDLKNFNGSKRNHPLMVNSMGVVFR